MADATGLARAFDRLAGWEARACRRPRPLARHDGVLVSVPPLDEFSFPSGHTLHAVSFTVVALAGVPQLAWLLVPFTTLVAMSRVVLGLHYVSDVLVGALIGWGLGQAGMLLLA